MRRQVISVTEAARNFADCVNRVRYQSVTFELVKNGIPVARLTPPERKVCLGRDLAKVLRRATLPPEEFVAWNRDLRKGRKMLKPPANKWE